MAESAPAETPQNEPSAIICRTDLLKFLDAEIQTIFERQSRQGWNAWALLGSIAALGWLLLERLQVGAYSIENVSRLALVIAVIIISFSTIKSFFIPESTTGKSGRFRYMDVYQFGSIILGTAYCGLYTWIVLSYSKDISIVATWFLVGFFVFVALLLFGFGLLARFSRIPMAVSSSPWGWKGKAFSGLFVLGLLMATSSFWFALGKITFDDFRIALLFTVLGELIGRLVSTNKDAPVVQSLIEIRRDLALERIDVRGAINQTDIVLAGMQVGDVLKNEVRAFQESVGKITAALQDVIARIDAVTAELPAQGELFSKEQSTVARTVLDACDDRTKTALKSYDVVKLRRDKLQSRIRWIGRRTEESVQGIEAVEDAVTKSLDDILARVKEYRSKADQLKKELS